LDQWILSLLHQLQVDVTSHMDNYDLVRASRPFISFINELSTWYVRRSRDRFKAADEEAKTGLAVLGYVLVELSKLLAPFTPFIAERIYKDLTGKESVHLVDWNEAGYKYLSEEEKKLLSDMEAVRQVVELGLAARKEANIKVRQPLEYLAYKFKSKNEKPLHLQEATGANFEETINQATEASFDALSENLEKILAEELNVKGLQFAPEIEVMPETVFKENQEAAVLLSVRISPELKEEGLARELERQVQELRKKFGFKVGELVDVYYNTSDAALEMALVERFDRRKTYVGQIKKELEVEADYEIQVEIEGRPLWLGLVKI
jgi:isoleucyl-tRNA synthetase